MPDTPKKPLQTQHGVDGKVRIYRTDDGSSDGLLEIEEKPEYANLPLGDKLAMAIKASKVYQEYDAKNQKNSQKIVNGERLPNNIPAHTRLNIASGAVAIVGLAGYGTGIISPIATVVKKYNALANEYLFPRNTTIPIDISRSQTIKEAEIDRDTNMVIVFLTGTSLILFIIAFILKTIGDHKVKRVSRDREEYEIKKNLLTRAPKINKEITTKDFVIQNLIKFIKLDPKLAAIAKQPQEEQIVLQDVTTTSTDTNDKNEPNDGIPVAIDMPNQQQTAPKNQASNEPNILFNEIAAALDSRGDSNLYEDIGKTLRTFGYNNNSYRTKAVYLLFLGKNYLLAIDDKEYFERNSFNFYSILELINSLTTTPPPKFAEELLLTNTTIRRSSLLTIGDILSDKSTIDAMIQIIHLIEKIDKLTQEKLVEHDRYNNEDNLTSSSKQKQKFNAEIINIATPENTGRITDLLSQGLDYSILTSNLKKILTPDKNLQILIAHIKGQEQDTQKASMIDLV